MGYTRRQTLKYLHASLLKAFAVLQDRQEWARHGEKVSVLYIDSTSCSGFLPQSSCSPRDVFSQHVVGKELFFEHFPPTHRGSSSLFFFF